MPLRRTPLVVILLISAWSATSAQYFFKHLALPGSSGGGEMTADANGGVHMAASLAQSTELSFNENGTITAGTQFALSDPEFGLVLRKVLPLNATHRVALGYTNTNTGTTSNTTTFVTRFAEGASSAQATLIGTDTNAEWPADIAVHGDNVVAMARTLFGEEPTLLYKMIVAKFDANLAPSWGISFDVPNTQMQPLRTFIDATTGTITCFALASPVGTADYRAVMLRLSPTGQLLGGTTYDSAGNGSNRGAVVESDDGGYYLLHELFNTSALELVLTKLSDTGSLLWSRRISATQPGTLADLLEHEGTLYAAVTTGSNGFGQNVLLMAMDTEGTVQWSHVHGVADRLSIAFRMLITTGTDGADAIWVSGGFRLNGSSPQDLLVMKVALNGTGLSCTLPDYTFTTAPVSTVTAEEGVLAPYTLFSTTQLDLGSTTADTWVTECAPVGTAEAALEERLVLSPVPSYDRCTLGLPQQHGVLQVILCDAWGRTVQEHRVPAAVGALELSLEELAAGTYAVMVTDILNGGTSALRLVRE